MLKLETILSIALLILITIALFAYAELKSQGTECLQDPIKYGINKVAEDTGKKVYVTISSDNINPLFLTSD